MGGLYLLVVNREIIVTLSPVPILTSNPVLRAAGALWFAAVLLLLLLLAMACATIYESGHSAEQALAVFYKSWWFRGLLALIGVNMLAAVIVRYPFSKRQIGFVLTHLGVLLILGGAWVTFRHAVNGHVSFAEGGSAADFSNSDTPTLTLKNDHERASIDLTSPVFKRFGDVEQPEAPVLTLGELHVEVQRFVPDSEWVQETVDDNPHFHPAVEVSLSASGEADPLWLFAGKPASMGPVTASLLTARTDEEWRNLLSTADDGASAAPSLVKIEYEGSTFDIPLASGLEHSVPLGDTGISIRILRYLPHALVDHGQLVNRSNQPVNPAVEVEVASAAGKAKRYAFANFPDLESMHGKKKIEGLKMTFVAPRDEPRGMFLQVLSGPSDATYVRFGGGPDEPVLHKLEAGVPVESPWLGRKFTVLRRFDHARTTWALDPVQPVRAECTPALLLAVNDGESSHEMWVRKGYSKEVSVKGVPYEVTYENAKVPLGFTLTLNRARTGRYPGITMPRAYESHITIADPNTGQTQDAVISMNRPMKYGGYSLFQSQMGPRSSVLSVSRDPGKLVAFAGYIITLLGMMVQLGQRIARHGTATQTQNNREETL